MHQDGAALRRGYISTAQSSQDSTELFCVHPGRSFLQPSMNSSSSLTTKHKKTCIHDHNAVCQFDRTIKIRGGNNNAPSACRSSPGSPSQQPDTWRRTWYPVRLPNRLESLATRYAGPACTGRIMLTGFMARKFRHFAQLSEA